MSTGHEPGFERRRGEVYSFGKHPVKEPLEPIDFASHDLRKIPDVGLRAEKETEHTADVIGCKRYACGSGNFPQPRCQPFGALSKTCVKSGRCDSLQCCETCRHRNRIA